MSVITAKLWPEVCDCLKELQGEAKKEFVAGFVMGQECSIYAMEKLKAKIALAHDRLGPSGYKLLIELKALREENEQLKAELTLHDATRGKKRK